MPGGQAPLEVRFDADEVRALVRDLKQLEGGKQLTTELRKNLKQAAEPIKSQVKSNASWSRRIPAAVAIGTAFSAKRTGIFIRVNANKAPHARPFENNGGGGTFRHPVFGGPAWVAQQARPFFFNETASHMPEVEEAAAEAVETAAKAAGFR